MDTADSRLAAALSDRYRIERELGRGGMATVYLAHDLRHDRPVALKVLRPELAASLGPDRFLQEIRIAARLQHPHILPLFDSGEAVVSRESLVASDSLATNDSRLTSFLYYVMPYVPGESLRDRLARECQLPLDQAVRIATQVLSALGYAHAHGVVHRDIKPENILLEGDQAVVADFGVARAITAAGDARLTETGITLGTPAYMSPEQALGTRELDGRSDLYAVGCVLYEMLAGQPPFGGATAQQLIARHAMDPVPPLRTVRDTVPEPVERSVTRALAKTPADRFRTAGDFAEALAAPHTTPAAATVPTSIATPSSTHPFLVRRRIVALAAAGLGVALAVAGYLWWPR
ncbi:MAG TPA: serine/threonine-protein kinase, partial [Gemmatimonadales bacterium]